MYLFTPDAPGSTLSRIAALLVAVAVLTACTTAKRTVLPSMQTQPLNLVDTDAYSSKYPDANGVFLAFDHSVEHVATKDNAYGVTQKWELYETIQRRYVVLDPDDEALTQFEESIDAEDLQTLRIRMMRPDGAVSRFTATDAETVTNEDGSQTLKIAYPNVTRGTVIEEVYDVKDESPGRFLDVALQIRYPVDSLRFRFAYPDWWKIRVKDIAEDEPLSFETSQDAENNKTTIRYSAADLPAVVDEPYSPFYKEMVDYFKMEIVDANFGNGYRLEGFFGWIDFGEQFEKFAIDKDPLFSREVKRTTEEVTEGATTDQEKVTRIMEYVTSNIEIDARSSASDFDDVIDEGSGHPYLVNGLVQAMLTRAGVYSSYLLVHSASDGYFDPEFYSISEMYIPGIAANVDGESVYLFPYLKDLPAGLIPQALQGQRALAIKTNDGYASLVDLPRRDGARVSLAEAYDVEISEEGVVSVTESRTYHGTLAYALRKQYEDLTEEETTDNLKETVSYTEGGIEWTTHEIRNPEAFGEPLEVELKYTIDNLVTLTPEEVLVQTSGLFSTASGEITKVNPNDRRNPIDIAFDQRQEVDVTIRYPESWTLTTELADVEFENDFGAVQSTNELTPGQITAKHRVSLRESKRPASEMSSLLDLIGSNSKLSIPTLVFQSGS